MLRLRCSVALFLVIVIHGADVSLLRLVEIWRNDDDEEDDGAKQSTYENYSHRSRARTHSFESKIICVSLLDRRSFSLMLSSSSSSYGLLCVLNQAHIIIMCVGSSSLLPIEFRTRCNFPTWFSWQSMTIYRMKWNDHFHSRSNFQMTAIRWRCDCWNKVNLCKNLVGWYFFSFDFEHFHKDRTVLGPTPRSHNLNALHLIFQLRFLIFFFALQTKPLGQHVT